MELFGRLDFVFKSKLQMCITREVYRHLMYGCAMCNNRIANRRIQHREMIRAKTSLESV